MITYLESVDQCWETGSVRHHIARLEPVWSHHPVRIVGCRVVDSSSGKGDEYLVPTPLLPEDPPANSVPTLAGIVGIIRKRLEKDLSFTVERRLIDIDTFHSTMF